MKKEGDGCRPHLTVQGNIYHVKSIVLIMFRCSVLQQVLVVLVLIKLEPLKKLAWEVEFIWRLMLPCAVPIPWVRSMQLLLHESIINTNDSRLINVWIVVNLIIPVELRA